MIRLSLILSSLLFVLNVQAWISPLVAPIANDDNATCSSSGAVVVNVATNDLNPGGGLLSYTLIQSPANGIAIYNLDGTYTYYNTSGIGGIDSFIYQICNSAAPPECDIATVYINVTVIPPPPSPISVGGPLFLDMCLYQNSDIDISAYVTNPDSDSLTYNLINDGSISNGMIWNYGDTTYLEIGNNGNIGSDLIAVEVCGSVNCDTFYVNLNYNYVLDTTIYITMYQNDSVNIFYYTPLGINAFMHDAGNLGSTYYGFDAITLNTFIGYSPNAVGTDSLLLIYHWYNDALIIPGNIDPYTCNAYQYVITVLPDTNALPISIVSSINVDVCSTGSIVSDLETLVSNPSNDVLTYTILDYGNFSNPMIVNEGGVNAIMFNSAGTVGLDTVQVQVCGNSNCDTILYFINYSNFAPTSTFNVSITNTGDYGHTFTAYTADTSAVNSVFVSLSPSNGTVTIDTTTIAGVLYHVAEYVPDSNFIGIDHFMVMNTYTIPGNSAVNCYQLIDFYVTVNNGNMITNDTVLVSSSPYCSNFLNLYNYIDTTGLSPVTFSIIDSFSVPTLLTSNLIAVQNAPLVGVDYASVEICNTIYCDTINIALSASSPSITYATVSLGDSLNLGYLSECGYLIIDSANTGFTNNSFETLYYYPNSLGTDTITYSIFCYYDFGSFTSCSAYTTLIINITEPTVDTVIYNAPIDVCSFGSMGVVLDNAIVGDDSLSYSIVDIGNLGNSVIFSDEVLYYDPSVIVGTDTVLVNACDTFGVCTTYGFIFNINHVIDTTVYISLPMNGSHTSTYPLTPGTSPSLIDLPNYGFASLPVLDTTYQVNYTPSTDFIGTDSILVSELLLNSNPTYFSCYYNMWIVYTVYEPASPFINCENDNSTTPINTSITYDVMNNDSIVPSPSGININILTPPVNGTGAVTLDNNIYYFPNTGFTGNDSLQYIVCTISGATLLCDTAWYFIEITDNTSPIASDFSVDVCAYGFYTFDLDNYVSSIDGDSVIYTVIDSANTALQVDDNNVIAIPNPNGNLSPFTISILVCDYDTLAPNTSCDTLEVTINPIINYIDTVYTSIPNNTSFGLFIGNPLPSSTNIISNYPTLGTTLLFNTDTIAGTDSLVYTPNVAMWGVDTFAITNINNMGSCASMLYVVNVYYQNQPPVALNDTVFIANDTVITHYIFPLNNDNDPNENVDTMYVITPPMHGDYEVTAFYAVGYTPDSAFFGIDSIQYVICDNDTTLSLCDTAWIYIYIGSDEAPVIVANNDAATTFIHNAVVINTNNNDENNSENFVISIESQPEHGTVVINEDGTITYTPNAYYAGIDQFVYVICDTVFNVCDTALVTIKINEYDVDSYVIPNAITPNGDNVNDVFYIEGIEYMAYSYLTIYNRWGNLVYETYHYQNNWAGTWFDANKDLPDGTYYYSIKFDRNRDEPRYHRTGFVVIKR